MQWDNPRDSARKAIRGSVSDVDWQQNSVFITRLRKEIGNHAITNHPAIRLLREAAFSKEAIKKIHLEYRHAMVQIFTDALLMAQFQCRQLEPRLTSGSKMHARFLLTLNVLDEFGFRPGVDANGYYRGNSFAAHYPMFEDVIDAMGISRTERNKYVLSEISQKIVQHLESTYDSLSQVVSLMAVGEEVVVLFSAPLRENTKAIGVNVQSGYYMCHGTSDDSEAEADDDTHEDDLWYILQGSLLPEEREKIAQLCMQYCDLWVTFWDEQVARLEGVVGHK